MESARNPRSITANGYKWAFSDYHVQRGILKWRGNLKKSLLVRPSEDGGARSR